MNKLMKITGTPGKGKKGLFSKIKHTGTTSSSMSEKELGESLHMTDNKRKVLNLISHERKNTGLKQPGISDKTVKRLEDDILDKMSSSSSSQMKPGSYTELKDTESKSKILKK